MEQHQTKSININLTLKMMIKKHERIIVICIMRMKAAKEMLILFYEIARKLSLFEKMFFFRSIRFILFSFFHSFPILQLSSE
jgi:hypothetical protein